MTEQDFLTSTDPQEMLTYLQCWPTGSPNQQNPRHPSDRKLRLFACAVARLKRPGEDVEVVEAAVEAGQPNHTFNDAYSRERGLFWKVCRSDEAARYAAAAYPDADVAALLREIVGNPWKPVTLADPVDWMGFPPGPQFKLPRSWLTPPVLALARDAYESRDFSALPILADALEEAGCDSLDLLMHLRGTVSHVRGCWATDLILGKS